MFLLNLFIAVVCTSILEFPFELSLNRTKFSMLKVDGLTSAAAFGLGWFVYGRWQPNSAKWLWVAGCCWFGYGMLSRDSDPSRGFLGNFQELFHF